MWSSISVQRKAWCDCTVWFWPLKISTLRRDCCCVPYVLSARPDQIRSYLPTFSSACFRTAYLLCFAIHRLSLPFSILSTRGNISGDMKRRRHPVSYTSASLPASHRCHLRSSLRRQRTRNTDTTYGSWLPQSRTGLCVVRCCVTHDENSAIRGDEDGGERTSPWCWQH